MIIKKSLIVAVLIVFIYSIVITVFKPEFNKGQSGWQTNIIRAQDFLYDNQEFQGIIVGSSLCRGIIMDSLPKSIFTLGFPAFGSLDGIQITLKKQSLPQVIYIEINSILSKENKSFLQTVAAPSAYYSRLYIPWLRQKYQPSGLLLGAVNNRFIEENKSVKEKMEIEDEQRTKKRIKKYETAEKAKKTIPDDKFKPIVEDKIKELKKYTDYLESKGVKIVFFEMPIDEFFCKNSGNKITLSVLYSIYPRSKYIYIDQPDCSEYETTDGIHIDHKGCIKYTAYFKEQLIKHQLIKL